MAQSKSDKKKASSKSAAPKKSVEAKAQKALDRAELSVQLAAEAVKGSRKKLRARADELALQTEKLIAKHAKAERKVEKAAKKAGKAAALSVAPARSAKAGNAGGTVLVIPEPTGTSAGSDLAASEASTGSTPVDVSVLTPPLPSPQPAAPTLITLRERARIAKIAGYSRMNKAALISALEATPGA